MVTAPQQAPQAIAHSGLFEFTPPCHHRNEAILRIYRAPNGQMAGRLVQGGVEIGGVAGCASSGDVEDAIIDAGFHIDDVVELDSVQFADATVTGLLHACRSVSNDIEKIGLVTVETVDLVRAALKRVDEA